MTTEHSHTTAMQYIAARLATSKPKARKGHGKLSHSDFMKTIRRVLGEEAEQYKGTYTDTRGRTQPCYYLPEEQTKKVIMASETPSVSAKLIPKIDIAFTKFKPNPNQQGEPNKRYN